MIMNQMAWKIRQSVTVDQLCGCFLMWEEQFVSTREKQTEKRGGAEDGANPLFSFSPAAASAGLYKLQLLWVVHGTLLLGDMF